MKRKLLFAAMLIAGALGQLRAQSWEDVTSFYLTNADFEGSYTQQATYSSGNNTRYLYAPNGWTVTHTNKNDNDITILKSGDAQSNSFKYFTLHPTDGGDQAYVVRFRWGGYYWDNGQKGQTDKIVLTQASTLPSGKYRLSAETAFITAEENPSGYLRIYADKTAGGSLGWKDAAITKGSRSGETISSGSASWVTTSTSDWDLDAETGVTFGIEFMQTWRWEIQAGIDNVKLERQCSEDSPCDVPVAKGAWTLNSGTYDNGNYVEHYANEQPTGEYLRYTMSGVPNGYYQVKLTMKSSSTSSRDSGPAAVVDGDTKYTSIVCGDVSQAVPSYNALDASTGASPAQYTLDYVYVDNGELVVKININEVGPNWIIAKMDGIKFYGDIPNRKAYRDALAAAQAAIDNNDYDAVIGTERSDLQSEISAAAPATTEACGTAATELETKTNTFTSAKDTYEALTREISKAKALGIATATADGYAVTSSDNAATALSNTQALKVAEYSLVNTNYAYSVDLGAWTKTGSTGSLSSQHWSGEAREYLEQSSSNWAASSWTIKYDQNVTLPAGNYVFKVAGRQANSDGVTLSLTVKNGETTLGTVNDFPRGDKGLGITTSGVTSFDPNDTFCNTRNNDGDNLQTNGGNGWEWRYVKFTLNDDATVNVSVDAVATEEHMWVSFCDATVQTDNAANVSLIAYNIALASAITARDAAANKYVGGTDRSNLVAAIAADENLDKNDASAIDAATATLNLTRETFIAGVSDWNAYTLAKNTTYAEDQPYASSEKYAAIATAKSGSAPSTAAEAATKAAAIKAAYRQYIESNALAEGVTGAVNMTNLISDPNMDVTYDGTAHTFGAWQVFGQTDGTIQLLSAESFTDGSGKNDYKYADIYKSDNNAGIKQTISNLAPGKYMLTVTARAQKTADATFGVFAGSNRTEITRLGNSGGVFDRGWNDASVEFYVTETSDVEIGVQSGNGKSLWWSATRFRLVRLGDASTPITISSAGWATLYTPDALDFSKVSGLKAYTATVSENTVILTQVNDVPANTGVVLKGAAGSYNIPWAASSTTDKGSLSGSATEATAYDAVSGYDLYMLALNDANEAQFTKVIEGSIAAGKAYLPVATVVNVKAFSVVFADVDAIESIANDKSMQNAEIFNLAGQRVNKAQRGIYIVNGKKVLVK